MIARPDGCPKCRCSLHYSVELDEQLCLECGWSFGDDCTDDWLPEHLYNLSEWHVVVGMLTKQFRANALSYKEYTTLVQQMGIAGPWTTLKYTRTTPSTAKLT